MAKRKPGKKHVHKIGKAYAAAGEKLERKNRNCPKCGPGVFMAAHKDRHHCGFCGYMEKVVKK
ncbi:MAG TPA: 30S ribosomal protein S27ae [Candidatus Nanoarchaeia archaeon]|nr:30S ribosomal protein S27ae [Candidatus Nanoarchaeia archaeon]